MDIVTQFINRVETDLNNIIHAAMPNVSFNIWSRVGKHRKKKRQAGNIAPYDIEGEFNVTASSMEANDLVIGVNGAEISFMVPIDPPRTSADQTPQDLQEVKDDQLWFVNAVGTILTNYFQSYKTFSFDETNADGDKVSYTIGVMGGASISGTVDISPVYGKAVPVNVYLEINIVQNGIVSTDIEVYIDNEKIPKQSFYPSRASELNGDVLSNSLDSKYIATSSALAFKINFPLTKSGVPSSELIKYLLRGEANTAHFVDIYGLEAKPSYYFMLISQSSAAVEGVSMVGGTMDMVQVLQYNEMVSVPKSYQVGAFRAANSNAQIISFFTNATEPFKAFVCSEVRSFGTLGSIAPKPDNFVDADDGYLVYIITDRAVDFTVSPTSPGVTFEIVKAAENG